MNKPVSYSAFAAWRAQHRAALASSIVRLFKRPISSLLSLSVMAIALSLPLAFAWSLLQIEQLSSTVQKSRAITVFFSVDVGVDQAKTIAETFRSKPSVAAIQVKTPDQGLKDFQQSSELAKAVSMLGKNPLPTVMIIEPVGNESQLITELEALPNVDQVQHDVAWQQKLNAWLDFGKRLIALLAGVFALGSVLAVANNVRLDIATREQEIAVLQQLGASTAYIRRPFLYMGGVLGLLAGSLAFVFIFSAAFYVEPSLKALISSYGNSFQFIMLPIWVVPVILSGSIMLGVVGAWFAVGHHMRATRLVSL
jgi:cell division transport system permease protein